MRIPRRGNIRSHRAKRRQIVAPWIVATTITVVVVAAVSTGFYFLVRQTCTGELTATVVAAPGTASLLESIARGWADTQPVVGGKCARVDIETRDSASTVEALSQRWNTKASGTAPDAWVPESTAWVRHASANPVVGRMLPPRPPSLARSVTVIAMPRPMAERLGWPKTTLTWQSLIADLAGSPEGWGRYGKPEWGPVKLGMSDPTKSTAGLHAMLAIVDAAGTGQASEAGRAAVGRLRQVQVYRPSTDDILNELTTADRQSADAALQYVSAFPALETDVFAYNQADPVVPLVAVYPADGSVDADNPYLVLQAPWSDQNRQRVATEFLSYARGGDARKTYRGAGFRGPDRAAGGNLTPDNGLVSKVSTRARTVPPADVVESAFTAWGA